MDTIPEALSTLYDECDRGRSNPSESSLVDSLFEFLDSDKLTYVIIDGLDECSYDPSGSERSSFNDLVLEELGNHPGCYNFLFTSRKEHDIEEGMKIVSKQTKLHTISIEAETVDADVRLHIQRFISGHKRISKWTASIRNEIETDLASGSQGM